MKHNVTMGMPTLIECKSIEENIILCKELGLHFIEINMNLPQFQPGRINPNYYRELMAKHGIFFTLHLPEELNISDFTPWVIDAYIKTVIDSINLAKEIDIPIINMHMNTGVYFTLPGRKVYLYEEYFGEYIHSIKEFGDIVSSLIENKSTYVLIENTGIYNLSYIRAAVKELLKRECFKLTWDIGHDFSSNCLDSDFILKNIKYLRHFHLHDAIGKMNHLPLGSGEIDLQSKIMIAGSNNCSCVIETKTIDGLRASVDFLRNDQYMYNREERND